MFFSHVQYINKLVGSGCLIIGTSGTCFSMSKLSSIYSYLNSIRDSIRYLRYRSAQNYYRRVNAVHGNSMVACVGSDEEFSAWVVHSEVPVLADFYADWCGPCHNLSPRLEAKVEGQQGKIHLAKVNVDHAGDIACDFDVTALPTVITFKHGEIVHRLEGADMSDAQIDHLIAELTEGEELKEANKVAKRKART